jgi:hypothetical protein
MRDRVLVLLTVIALYSIAAFSQAPAGQRQGGRSNAVPAAPDTTPFDAHDLSGIWLRLAPRGGDRSISAKAPPLTPAGKARMAQNLPARSRTEKPAPDDPADSNDPAFRCNPQGFPRIVIDTAHDYHEVIQLKDRILQLWQEERRPREIWMDGRPVPSGENLDNLGPAWYGHSVGHWEGDTLVVETVGLDDRAWVDLFGYPKSLKARVVERYRRTDASTLTLQLTLNDSEYYTQPWVSDLKTWKKQPREKVTWFGWYGLFSGAGELVCAPMNASAVNKHGG